MWVAKGRTANLPSAQGQNSDQYMISISTATKKDVTSAFRVATHLPEWFSIEGLKNLKIDFLLNNVFVAHERGKVIGFICYTSYSGKMLLLWMGVAKANQRSGVGEKLLARLVQQAKRLRLHSIEVETLSDKDSYAPYQRTHAFYAKHGFKKVLYKKARIAGWDDQVVLEKML